ncbi:MAG: type II toxin-antitoxin system RelE/ParE family toxin [Nanoarchaeota archaeon]|nr:type II toxin-antitoxin system RelE/ParE family toxin [Nanoarchaeota archaeon]
MLIPRDIKGISAEYKKRIEEAVEKKLKTRPEAYAVSLRRSLKGFWKLRVGDYRIVFQIKEKAQEVFVLTIKHRSIVYEIAEKRI